MLRQRNQWLLLLATSLVNFMCTIDASIVTIAVPQLSRGLQTPMNKAEWVVSAYLVTICVLLIFFGKLSDEVGRVPIFQIGTLVFVAGSLWCGLSGSLLMMLVARLVQATGASMVMATNFGIITQIFPANRHGVALGINSAFGQLGNIMGPGLGGIILSTLSWHYIFFINVPLGLIVFFFGYKIFPKEEHERARVSVDLSGFISYALMIISFFVGVYWGQEVGFGHPAIIALWVMAAILLVSFINIERRVSNPLINLGLFNNGIFNIGVITTILVFAVGYFNNVVMPFYLQETLKYSSAIAGLIMMAIPLLNVVSAPIGGMLGDRIGSERVSLYAAVLFIVPECLFVLIAPSWGLLWLVVGLMLFGLANGLFQNNPMVMSNAGSKFQGVAGSIAALARNLGMALGLSLSTTLLYSGISRKAGRRVTTYPYAHKGWFLFGMHVAYFASLVMIIVMIILLTVAVGMLKRKKERQRV